jgi:hypothetical protein
MGTSLIIMMLLWSIRNIHLFTLINISAPCEVGDFLSDFNDAMKNRDPSLKKKETVKKRPHESVAKIATEDGKNSFVVPLLEFLSLLSIIRRFGLCC